MSEDYELMKETLSALGKITQAAADELRNTTARLHDLERTLDEVNTDAQRLTRDMEPEPEQPPELEPEDAPQKKEEASVPYPFDDSTAAGKPSGEKPEDEAEGDQEDTAAVEEDNAEGMIH